MMVHVMKKHNTKQCPKSYKISKGNKNKTANKSTNKISQKGKQQYQKGSKRAEEQQEEKCPVQGEQLSSTTPQTSFTLPGSGPGC